MRQVPTYLHCNSPYIRSNATSHYSLLGNVYFADTNNQRIRKVTVSTGIITTIAGTGTNSYSGDNGEAKFATLTNPLGVAVDSSGTYLPSYNGTLCLIITRHYLLLGNVYIADSGNLRVRKVTAGTGSPRYSLFVFIYLFSST